MRVLQIAPTLPAARRGGTELYSQWLAEALAEEHEVAVATVRGAATHVEGATVYALPETDGWRDPTGRRSGLERGVDDEAVDRAVRDLLVAVDPDVVHCQHLVRTSASIPERCAERGVPCVLTLHDFWTLCHRGRLDRPDGEHCSGPESVEKCAACYADGLSRTDSRERRAAARDGDSGDDGELEPAGSSGDEADPPEPRPLDRDRADVASSDDRDGDDRDGDDREDDECQNDAHERGGERSERESVRSSSAGERASGSVVRDRADVRPAVERRQERLEAARAAADLLIAPSTFVRDRFVAYGTSADRTVTCPGGVRTERYVDTGFDPEESVDFGYAGRIAPSKGVHVLVEAFRTVGAGAQLHVFGAFDPEEREYHARLREVAGEAVTFHGSHDSSATPYRVADVLVVPSLSYESRPVVVQEAFAAGVPVVAGDEGGTAELVDHGRNGLTYPVGDPVALANGLRALADDPDRVQQLRAGVEQPKSMAHHAREVASLYETLVDRGSRTVGDADLRR